MDEPESGAGGFFGSARRMAHSILGLFHTRLELAAVELQEETSRVFDLLLRVAAFVVVSVLALMSGTALIVVVAWDYSPVLALASVTAVYGLAALGLWVDLKKRLDTAPPPFADTLAEFKKDAECFREQK